MTSLVKATAREAEKYQTFENMLRTYERLLFWLLHVQNHRKDLFLG